MTSSACSARRTTSPGSRVARRLAHPTWRRRDRRHRARGCQPRHRRAPRPRGPPGGHGPDRAGAHLALARGVRGGAARPGRQCGRRRLDPGRQPGLRGVGAELDLPVVHGPRDPHRRDGDRPRLLRSSSSGPWCSAPSSDRSRPSGSPSCGGACTCSALATRTLVLGFAAGILATLVAALVGRALGWVTYAGRQRATAQHGIHLPPRPVELRRGGHRRGRRGAVADVGADRWPGRRLHLGDDGAGGGEHRARAGVRGSGTRCWAAACSSPSTSWRWRWPAGRRSPCSSACGRGCRPAGGRFGAGR